MRKLLKRSLIQRLNTLRLYVLLAPKSPSANVARYRIRLKNLLGLQSILSCGNLKTRPKTPIIAAQPCRIPIFLANSPFRVFIFKKWRVYY